jgi:hypothetical protein
VVGLFALLCHYVARSEPGCLVTPPAPAVRQANAKRILDWERSQLQVREHGYNRGPEVESYLRTTGNTPGSEWCGAFQATANARCKLPMPAGAGGSYNWFLLTSPRTLFFLGVVGSVDVIQPGDRIGFWNPSKRRIGHIGIVETKTRHGFTTIEGNVKTGINAGVHRLSRGRGEIHAASNWSY